MGENLHRFYTNFEHEIGYGGGSGDSGGIFTILLRMELLFRLARQNHQYDLGALFSRIKYLIQVSL
jgi:hypothetical protein